MTMWSNDLRTAPRATRATSGETRPHATAAGIAQAVIHDAIDSVPVYRQLADLAQAVSGRPVAEVTSDGPGDVSKWVPRVAMMAAGPFMGGGSAMKTARVAVAEVAGGDLAAAAAEAALGALGTAGRGAGQTFEVLDGVRRAKAAAELGQTTIEAQVQVGGKVVQTGQVPIDALRSPFKSAVDVSNPTMMQRWLRVLNGTRAGDPLPPDRYPARCERNAYSADPVHLLRSRP